MFWKNNNATLTWGLKRIKLKLFPFSKEEIRRLPKARLVVKAVKPITCKWRVAVKKHNWCWLMLSILDTLWCTSEINIVYMSNFGSGFSRWCLRFTPKSLSIRISNRSFFLKIVSLHVGRSDFDSPPWANKDQRKRMTVSTKGSVKSKQLHVAHYGITHLITEAPQAKKSTLLLRIADLPLENRIPE